MITKDEKIAALKHLLNIPIKHLEDMEIAMVYALNSRNYSGIKPFMPEDRITDQEIEDSTLAVLPLISEIIDAHSNIQ